VPMTFRTAVVRHLPRALGPDPGIRARSLATGTLESRHVGHVEARAVAEATGCGELLQPLTATALRARL
jgi:hypothetical protein